MSSLGQSENGLQMQGSEDGAQKSVRTYTPRAYQLEMLDESLKRNIILAMDTGSGKTLVAILRIRAELERCSPEKAGRVWFCVPTVALAIQQHESISQQLPTFQSRILSGTEKCELWSKQWIWDDMLKGIRIVICTHEILLDALTHAFVGMEQIALLCLDEAHSAVKKHPANKIMGFYHSAEFKNRPFILGLTASPVVNRRVGGLSILESNLNAISRTPKRHRDELLQNVNRPELIELNYVRLNPNGSHSLALQSLCDMYKNLDIEQDPYVKRLRSEAKVEKLKHVLMSHETYCSSQIKKLYNVASYIATELGAWATDLYIGQCIQKFCSETGDTALFSSLDDTEKAYIRKKLGKIHVPNIDHTFIDDSLLSPKVHLLIDFLRQEESMDFSGLVFVERRAEAAALSHLLSVHPRMRNFSVCNFVGVSTFSGRKYGISDLADAKSQKTSLEDLRHGRINLIVATNALEEGIDVSACNVVVCCDKPKTLKSFIQRRGRARRKSSKYAIMLDDAADPEATSEWQTLEELMRQTYMDDMRELEEFRRMQEGEEEGERAFRVESTGAVLTLDNSVSHLYHFCNVLPKDPYSNPSPIFFYEDKGSVQGGSTISARVLLPSSVDATVREARSKVSWTKEKSARKDAAFEAYVALYHANLVDANLLPIGRPDHEVDAAYTEVEKRPNLVEVSEQLDIWPFIAEQWQDCKNLSASLVTVEHDGKNVVSMYVLLPLPLPLVPEFVVYWDEMTTFDIKITSDVKTVPWTSRPVAAKITTLLLSSVLKTRLIEGREDYTALFIPADTAHLDAWLDIYSGTINARNLCDHQGGDHFGLVRDLTNNNYPCIYRNVRYATRQDMLSQSMSQAFRYQNKVGLDDGLQEICRDSMDVDSFAAEPCTFLEVNKLSKRADFLHPLNASNKISHNPAGLQWLFADLCEVDKLPFKYARFALLIPTILGRLQKAFVAEALTNEILAPLKPINSRIVATAISASVAQESTNYERIELLGDTILKFSTSLALMAEHLNYHEGILAHKKDHIVSNGSLARAALKVGLDKYILTTPFTGLKWRPPYVDDALDKRPAKTREMSTKVLADVVEALIGSAYLDGGIDKALESLAVFLPDVPWSAARRADEILYATYGFELPYNTHLDHVEQTIGYIFGLKSLLLEAITHPSYQGPRVSASYNRLEFLGDAVLDNIVTVAAFSHEPPIPVFNLHLIRSVLVNANFLGFLCLRLSTPIIRAEAKVDKEGNVSTFETPVPFYLWQAMRPAISAAQNSCLQRYNTVETSISESLASGERCPWTALAYVEPPKFFSDIVESIVGAIFIDSHGSLNACTTFLERLGVMPYLRRLLEGHIALLHPKEELGRLANQDRVHYEMGTEGEDGAKKLTCAVHVGDRQVVTVGGGLTPMEVQTRAADEACKVMRRGNDTRNDGDAEKEENGGADELKAGNRAGGGFEIGNAQGYAHDSSDEDVYMTADE